MGKDLLITKVQKCTLEYTEKRDHCNATRMIRLLNMNYTRCNMGRYVRGRSCLNMMSVIYIYSAFNQHLTDAKVNKNRQSKQKDYTKVHNTHKKHSHCKSENSIRYKKFLANENVLSGSTLS